MASTNTPAAHEEPPKKSYKEQLDEAALKAKDPQGDKSQSGVVNTVVEKVSPYVPGVGKILGHGDKEATPTHPESQLPGQPERPCHDLQIQEFVRDQHRSKIEDDVKSTD